MYFASIVILLWFISAINSRAIPCLRWCSYKWISTENVIYHLVNMCYIFTTTYFETMLSSYKVTNVTIRLKTLRSPAGKNCFLLGIDIYYFNSSFFCVMLSRLWSKKKCEIKFDQELLLLAVSLLRVL